MAGIFATDAALIIVHSLLYEAHYYNNEQARSILGIYGRTWESQDSELIISIFTKDATSL